MDDQILLNKRYRLSEPIGRGGMAMVFLGQDLMLERDIAVKLLRSQYAKDPAFRERFRQEAKAAANLSHPNLVTIYDFGYDQQRLYIVMEYVPGDDLNSIIHEKGRLSIKEGLELGIKACKGIGYAHRAGLVHCDVKPHNFLVTADHQLKVTDFGIARALASINPDEQSEVVWGSPQYFSPEQASGEAPSPSSDVYSLGVVLYLMFTGQLPFIGKTSSELARLHRNANPIPPRELNPFISAELEEVILKVLAKEPSARYRTADQLGRVLQMILDQTKANNSQNINSIVTPQTPKPQAASTPNPPIAPVSPNLSPATQPPLVKNSSLQPDPLPASAGIDWTSVTLALLAVASWGGLIPFFIWVYHNIF
ncbi:MAG: protein kinase [Chloroflexota bacterium]